MDDLEKTDTELLREHSEYVSNSDSNISLPVTIIDDDNNRCLSELEEIRLSFKNLQHKHEELQKTYAETTSSVLKLEADRCALRKEVDSLNEKMTSHGASAKRTVASLQQELKNQCDNLQRQLIDSKRDKENLVLKFAQSEAKHLELQRSNKDFEGRLREAQRERETMLTRARAIKADRDNLAQQVERKTAEATAATSELQRLRGQHSSEDVRAQWAENRFKEEQEAHRDTRRRLDQAREEAETIRLNCAKIVKQYQEGEDIKSNSLNARVREMTQRLDEVEAERGQRQRELEETKEEHKEVLNKNRVLAENLACLEAERLCQAEKLTRVVHELEQARALLALEQDACVQVIELRRRLAESEAALVSTKEELGEIRSEADALRRKEAELLAFTQRLSDRHASLQADNLTACDEQQTQSAQLAKTRAQLAEIELQHASLQRTSKCSLDSLSAELDTLKHLLEERNFAYEALSVRLEDERNEVRTLKKKHASATKDLTRQLANARRRLEATAGQVTDVASLGSRTSSTSSLDHLTTSNGGSRGHLKASHACSSSSSSTLPNEMSCDFTPEIKLVEPDRQALIEKIVRLQRDLGRKNEKLDFMQEHIRQLTDEVQRKKRLLQGYFMREECGSMTHEAMDLNKAAIARKGGSIMAAIFNSSDNNANGIGSVPIPVSLEINHKLQTLLEDTILKNMTLKDSMTTLGEEIARLSQENRRLQLEQNRTAIVATNQ